MGMDRLDRLDHDMVRTLREMTEHGQPDFLGELISLFLDTFTGQLEMLIDEAEKADLAAMQRISHDLKSSSASVGAIVLASHCAELETMARSGVARGTLPLVYRIAEEFRDVRPELESLLVKAA